MRRFYIGILLFICLPACKKKVALFDPYPKDTTLTNTHGIPFDSSTFYLPPSIKTDSGLVASQLDSFHNEELSKCLQAFHEPILYNYFLDTNRYRFLWLPSFYNPIVITLNKKNEKCWLRVKRLNKYPNMTEISNVNFLVPIVTISGSKQAIHDTIQAAEDETEFEKKLKAKLTVDYDSTIQLTQSDWKDFEKLLTESLFWTIQSQEKTYTAIDGSEWIIEAHLKNKYWFVAMRSPKNEFKKLGEFFISKSGLHTEVY